jgi:hypothetical protein
MNLFGLKIGGRSKKSISPSYNDPTPVPKEIKLDEDLGEIICPKCEGRGTISEIMDDEGFVYNNTRICSKCWGKGKLDWIEQATGVEPPTGITDFPYTDGITKLAGSAGRGVVNGC